MNARLLLTLLCVAALSTACVNYEQSGCPTPNLPLLQPEESGDPISNPPPPLPGNVKFSMTFGGLDSYAPSSIHILAATPGKPFLDQTWTYRYPNGTLRNLEPGTYLFELRAMGWPGGMDFRGHGTFTVNGDQAVSVDLEPTSSAPGTYVKLNWTFPDNASCSQAGVESVDVTIMDNHVYKTVTVPCWKGQTAEGLTAQYVLPGGHGIRLVARDANGVPLHSYDGQFTTSSYQPFHASYSLHM